MNKAADIARVIAKKAFFSFVALVGLALVTAASLFFVYARVPDSVSSQGSSQTRFQQEVFGTLQEEWAERSEAVEKADRQQRPNLFD